MNDRIRTAFIGLNPDSHWAATAHMPALRALSDQFEVVGVANSNEKSAQRSAEAFGLRHAFATTDELCASPDVDLVIVTVKVPFHLALVTRALEHGKHVYCEWPLGNGLAEAEQLAALARQKGVVAAVGTQARVSPEVQYLKRLVAEGFVGQVLSTTIVADGLLWGAASTVDLAYLYDAANGATMQSIPLCHSLAAVREVLGEIDEVAARFTTLRPEVAYLDREGSFTRTSPDNVIVMGNLESGAALNIHYRGGMGRGTGFLWEINGSKGDIQVHGANGQSQFVDLALRGASGEARELEVLSPPAEFYAELPGTTLPRNVACIYRRIAADIRSGSRTAPNFDDAVDLHKLLERIERSAAGAR